MTAGACGSPHNQHAGAAGHVSAVATRRLAPRKDARRLFAQALLLCDASLLLTWLPHQLGCQLFTRALFIRGGVGAGERAPRLLPAAAPSAASSSESSDDGEQKGWEERETAMKEGRGGWKTERSSDEEGGGSGRRWRVRRDGASGGEGEERPGGAGRARAARWPAGRRLWPLNRSPMRAVTRALDQARDGSCTRDQRKQSRAAISVF